jgi:secondary thiamine-phosphate synthase enzyme
MTTQHAKISLQTQGDCHMIDITERLQDEVSSGGLLNGLCTVFCPGSTGSIIIIEYEEGLLKDFPEAMERLAPEDIVYEHHLKWHDGNGHSHIRASIVGPSMTIPFVDKELTLGTWQQVTFVDFDNKPRNRVLHVMMMGE